MTLRSIALKNIKGNLNKFVMYYLSNTLVVMVFFIFANFLINPRVHEVKVMGQMGAITSEGMYLCEIVILIFTVVFTNYSISSFLKSREKEFGLLSMFGMTKSEIRSYVMIENLAVSLFSILTGIMLGMLFSKLFFMAISAILALNSELPLFISWKAIALTVACFLALFQGIGYISTFRIKNNNIIELLRGSRIAKPIPKFSKVKAILSVILIISGYVLAIFPSQLIGITMLPILILTITGTYFLYSQFSVYFTTKLQEKKGVFYKGINMVTLSQIIFKLRDNARILFAVSILSAVTLTASATVYSFQNIFKIGLEQDYPQDMSFIETGLNSHGVISPEQVDKILKSNGDEIEYKNKITLIGATNTDLPTNKTGKESIYPNKKDFYVMSNTDYNFLAKQEKAPEVKLNSGEVIVCSYYANGAKRIKLFSDKDYLKLNIEGEATSLKLKEEICRGIINVDQKNTNIAVVSDEDFNKLKDKASDGKLQVYYGYNIKNWTKAAASVQQVKANIPEEMRVRFSERVTNYAVIMQGMSLFFFIGTFISILFFIATGSLLYFKLFNEVQKDKHEFIALKKIGMSMAEVKDIVSSQCFIMFFLPFIVAFIHTCFAIKALSNILRANLSLYLMVIVGIYLIMQTLYYVFAKTMYVRQVNRWE